MARRFRSINSRFEKGRDLIQIGAYAGGADPGLDEAIRLHDGMTEFLQQDMFSSATLENSVREMVAAIDREGAFS